jgi:pyruvate dehydrogenase E2 component (dihydrolipoamide acetyltransferase)
VAILSLGQLKKAFELDENNAIRPFDQITMTLGCDHRAVDGVAGAKFLADVKESLSQPSNMFD